MGFVSEELNETEKQLIKDGKASNMAVVYGKEASIWKVSMAAASRAPGTSQPLPGPQAIPPPGLGIHPSPPAPDTENVLHAWMRKEVPNCRRKYCPGGS